MEALKLSYEIDRLCDLIEERTRLVSVLKIQPSAKDNVELKKHLNSTLDLLQELEGTETDERFGEYAAKYNQAIENFPDDLIDKELYIFHRKTPERSSTPELGQKRVRFKDALVEYQEEQPQFDPYSDTPDEDVALKQDKDRLFNQRPEELKVVTPNLTNQDLFIQQQQELLEQDSHLDYLSQSVHKTYDLSLDINHEVTQQNDQVLQDLESLVDTSGRNLNRANKRLEIFEKAARENGPCFTILGLVLILIFLLVIL